MQRAVVRWAAAMDSCGFLWVPVVFQCFVCGSKVANNDEHCIEEVGGARIL